MPSTEPSSSAWYSPVPACSTAGSRSESSTVAAAIRRAISEIVIARSSIRSEPEIRSWAGSFQRQISSPAVVARASRVSPGTPRLSGWKTPLSRTMQRPAVSAITGESAA